MVEYIVGMNGIGKSRLLAETAVETARQSKGNVVFIDCSNKQSLSLPTSIRLINVKEYHITSAMSFYGFLLGLCASDYDLTDVFVDSFLDIIENSTTNLNDFMDMLSASTKDSGVSFHFSVCDSYERELSYQNA